MTKIRDGKKEIFKADQLPEYITDSAKRAILWRDETTEKNKADFDYEDKLLKYNRLLAIARKLMFPEKKPRYRFACKLLLTAVDIFPDKFEARWGMATCLCMLDMDKEAIVQYGFLLDDFRKTDHARQIHFDIGIVLAQIDYMDASEYHIMEAAKLNIEHGLFFEKMGYISKKRGRPSESLRFYKLFLAFAGAYNRLAAQ